MVIDLPGVLAGYGNSFRDRFGYSGRHHEEAKWCMADRFRKYWDAEAEDFEAMFRRATENFYDLAILDVEGHLPLYATRQALPNRAEKIRDAFRALFDEESLNRGWKDAAESFCDSMNAALGKGGIYQLQDASFFLSMRYPDAYYIYKPRCVNPWCRLVGNGKFFSGTDFDAQAFFDVCEHARGILLGSAEIMERYRAFLRERDFGWSDDLHLLVYDLMYYLAYYLAFR